MLMAPIDWGAVQRQRIEADRGHFKMSFGLGSPAAEKSSSRGKIAPGRSKKGGNGGSLGREIVVVALNACKGVTRYALEWALINVVHPGDSIVLLALLPPASSGWKFWQTNSHESASKERKRLQEAKRSCQIMLEQLQSLSDARKVHTVVRLIPAAGKGVITLEAKKLGATWVLLDRNLKSEEKSCTELLECNLVIVKRNNAKILRLNLKQSPKTTPTSKETDFTDSRSPLPKEQPTPSSSPELGTPFTLTDRGNSPASSSTSPFSSAEPTSCTNSAHGNSNLGVEAGYIISESDTDEPSEPARSRHIRRSNVMEHSTSRRHQASEAKTKPQMKPQMSTISRLSLSMREGNSRENPKPRTTTVVPPSKTTDGPSPRFILSDFLTSLRRLDSKRISNPDRTTYAETAALQQEPTSVRKAVSLSTHAPLGPPPLCSICQHKAPAFGRPPRAFTFEELELATGGFSQANFLAEGGFGSVHRGILPEGQVVAVKQHKLASSQGDVEFCSEVEVLSCAQHRNVVMLIGYCIEDSRRLLVYEYICNGSLDAHIYGRGKAPLEWQHRRKIAVGAARGLRYLHEECRVGCIVHRDMRPNNILLTHDYEPMVGDFGLARWQPDGELGVETRVIGTFGYLAPEYTQSGQITEKADVYSFGVVLLELVTGRKAIDISRPKGQQCLTEWARILLKKRVKSEEMVDPNLEGCYDHDELDFMLHAASLCISRDPNTRPRMSQVLRILEGDLTLDGTPVGASGRLSYDGGHGNGGIPSSSPSSRSLERRSVSAFGGRHSNRICSGGNTSGNTSVNLTLEELKAAYREKMAHSHGSSRRLSLGDVLY